MTKPEPTPVLDDDFDWRIEDMGFVAEGELAGRRLLLLGSADHKRFNTLSFVMPHPAALALNVALTASAMAESLRPRLSTVEAVGPKGERGLQIREECTANLYTFFEQSMVAVTMSFQGLELFANAAIGRRTKGQVTIKEKGGIRRDLSPAAAERELSTEDKFAQVLPVLFNVPSPKGNRVWNYLKWLKRYRDTAVHLKSTQAYSNYYERLDHESLFSVFLNTDARNYPKAAMRVLRHYAQPRWLNRAEEIAKKYAVMTPYDSAVPPQKPNEG